MDTRTSHRLASRRPPWSVDGGASGRTPAGSEAASTTPLPRSAGSAWIGAAVNPAAVPLARSASAVPSTSAGASWAGACHRKCAGEHRIAAGAYAVLIVEFHICSGAEEAAAARQGGDFPLPGALRSHGARHRDEPRAQGAACAGAAGRHVAGMLIGNYVLWPPVI